MLLVKIPSRTCWRATCLGTSQLGDPGQKKKKISTPDAVTKGEEQSLGKGREMNRTNSMHFVRYSWTASTQTQSRPAHDDLRENADTLASKAAARCFASHARKRSRQTATGAEKERVFAHERYRNQPSRGGNPTLIGFV